MNKQTIKQFLKPSRSKFIIFLILVCLVLFFSSWFRWNVLQIRALGVGLDLEIGLPFEFYSYKTPTPLPDAEKHVLESFNIANLLLDLIIWYLISCSIVFAYNKFRKAKQ